jgi:hypothetical protein
MQYDLVNEHYYGKRTNHLYESGQYLKDAYIYGLEVISDRVVRKHAMASTKEMFEIVQAICLYFIRHPSPLVVPTYAFEAVGIPNSQYAAHSYHYDMMRMGTLTQEEKDFLSEYRYNRNKKDSKFSGRPKMADFLDQVLAEGRYRDLHDGNVMKDEDDNFRLVDLEGFLLSPIDRKENDWLKE